MNGVTEMKALFAAIYCSLLASVDGERLVYCDRLLVCNRDSFDWMVDRAQEALAGGSSRPNENIMGRLCNSLSIYERGDNQSSWSHACISSGNRHRTFCGAAPQTPDVFGYIRWSDYYRKLDAFRASLGCPPWTPEERELLADGGGLSEENSTGELYYCRDRCAGLGMSEWAFPLVMFSILAAIFYLLMRVPDAPPQ